MSSIVYPSCLLYVHSVPKAVFYGTDCSSQATSYQNRPPVVPTAHRKLLRTKNGLLWYQLPPAPLGQCAFRQGSPEEFACSKALRLTPQFYAARNLRQTHAVTGRLFRCAHSGTSGSNALSPTAQLLRFAATVLKCFAKHLAAALRHSSGEPCLKAHWFRSTAARYLSIEFSLTLKSKN